MARFLFLIVAVLALGLSSPQADASACAVDQYLHNRSVMEVQVCDPGSVTISYVRPRQGLIPHGVRNGTLLFDGIQQANGVITGQARIFNSRCGAITYSVSGSNQGGSIVLNGSAPVRNKNCNVTRHRSDRLVFTLQGAGPVPGPGGGPPVVTPSCPPGYVLSGGQCVRAAAPAPSCPPGFVFSQGQCVLAGAPAPAPPPAPAPSAGDWYAIAGSFKARSQAQARVNQLGPGWFVMNTSQCPNFRNGYWIATAGGFGKQTAQLYVNQARRGAYRKTCH